ncbi:MAG TPA: DNA polymerase III subunit delta [Gammaproteobacteria bacterium]|nr:DNA polymerase III subunit delta [Gammaproteobacteria bacterium]
MKLPLRQLDRHLKEGLAKVYLVAGDEPLLVDEALEQIRAAAKRSGFATRELHAAERSFRWAELAAGADNLSLFASRKIVEIRLATPKPGDEGSRTIAELCERADPDTLLIVAVSQKLDSAAGRSAWVKAIEQHGVVVDVWPIDRGELPRWVQQRAQSVNLKLTNAAAQSLAERVEGNLLAADQEIKRLALAAAGREVDEGEVLEFVANNSRFDIFGLADAVLAGETGRTFKILAGLRAEGVHPVQISWVLNRDISLLARLEYAVRHGENVDGALMQSGVWRRRQPLVKSALRRFRASRLKALLIEAARVDAALKGVFPAEPWITLTDLLVSLLRPAEGARAR